MCGCIVFIRVNTKKIPTISNQVQQLDTVSLSRNISREVLLENAAQLLKLNAAFELCSYNMSASRWKRKFLVSGGVFSIQLEIPQRYNNVWTF